MKKTGFTRGLSPRRGGRSRSLLVPYRTKVVEPLSLADRSARVRLLKEAGYNVFSVPAGSVLIDLISDSGTGAMSSAQWAAMMEAREDFSGQSASRDFIDTARAVTGMPFIQPVHQGRAAESILFKLIAAPGDAVLSNTHFETTRGNLETLGCAAYDLSRPEPPYYGNLDIERARQMAAGPKRIRALIMTLTSNINGGQPVSLENFKRASILAKRYGLRMIMDACRFADNAYLVREYSGRKDGILRISRRTFDLCDIAYMSNKKDGLANIGGFIAVRDKKLFERLGHEIIRQESYPSSGGMAARDLAAMKIGLEEAVNEDLLASHIHDLRYLAAGLVRAKVKIFTPVGGHGIVVYPKTNARYAAYSLAAAVYAEAGVRGGVFNDEFRLALPRRVYNIAHLEYAAETIAGVYHSALPKMRCVYRPRHFFNFFARFSAD